MVIQYYTKNRKGLKVDFEETARKIEAVKRQIARLGDMRPGHLSVQYRKSGTKSVKEIGYNQLSYTYGGRSRTEYVRDEDLPRIRREIEEFRRFKELCDELAGLSIELSKLRTLRRIDSEG